MPKMISKTTYWWVTDPTYNPDVPSAALLTTAANISCAIVEGSKCGPIKSDVDNSASICDTSHVETPTFYNYEAMLSFFREGDLANTTSDFYKAFQFFKAGTAAGLQVGYLVKRVGYVSSAAAAVGQAVSSYKFIPDNPKDVDDGTAPIKFDVTFKKQGKMSLFVALAA